MFSLQFSSIALKHFEKIPGKFKSQINSKLDLLCRNPYSVINNSVPIEGEEGLFRIKSGYYRIIYSIQNLELIVFVVDIDHRKDVYR